MSRRKADLPITARQRQVLRWIVDRITRTGVPPTYRELAAHLGVGINAAFCHFDSLLQKGYVTYPPGDVKTRSMSVAGLKITAAPSDDDAGRRLAAALAPAEELTPAA